MSEYSTAVGPPLPGRARHDPRRLERGAPAAPARLASRALSWLLAGCACALYAAHGVRRQHRLETTGFDLGIFEQVVRSYAHGRAPVADLKGAGYNVFGDHFHPILALLAPVYRVFPAAETLLVAQALLVGLSVLPVTRAAVRRCGVAGGTALGVAYALSWGLQSLLRFDFHEVAFAVPLLAFALAALVEGRLRAAVAWSVPLVLVKEDLGVTVAVVGLLVAHRAARALEPDRAVVRYGFALAVFGLVVAALVVGVVLPAANPDGGYPYWDSFTGGSADTLGPGARVEQQLHTVWLLLLVTGGAALRSPVVLVALPTLGWRFLSDVPLHWGTHFHYSATLMPVLFLALIDAWPRLRAARRWVVRGYARVLPVGCLLVAVLLVRDFPFRDLSHATFWRGDPRYAAARHMVDLVPEGVPVSATNHLVPQLTSRNVVSLLPDPRIRPGWVVADTWAAGFPVPVAEQNAYLGRLRAAGCVQVGAELGFVVLRCDPPGPAPAVGIGGVRAYRAGTRVK
ncbi:DUF2079 domain-containing protein [Embleya sp. NPDC020630]|uniref:DUF2079 domain-containing protein n=1 Tax=Embleya sp. NPDC020630 TaxID=3363979 RepID=UPI0037BC9AC0